MGVILYRVDDRLIHGQVTVGWARALQPDAFIIVDDEVAANPWEEKLFQSAAPEPLGVSVWSVKDALIELPLAQKSAEKAIFLTRDLKTMSELLRGGIDIPAVNLGGLHFSHDKIQVLPYIAFSREDIDILLYMREMGVDIDVRDVPTTDRKDVFQLLKSRGLLDE
jgi:mannose/fructose/N-acetylgalactosamine-specific phosphotransferase system component IIB